jgi:hypothetical protein
MLIKWKGLLALAVGLGLEIGLPAVAMPTLAQPGAVNYIEGQAKIDNQVLTSKAVGSAALNSGDVLSTGTGRVEFLLTPGVFMRLGKNSSVRMDTPELMNTQVELLSGEAMVEVDLLYKEDHIRIAERGGITELETKGIYAFNADLQTVQVYDGKAAVRSGDQSVDLKKGKELALNQALKTQKFDRTAAEVADPLYGWSKLRSEYLAESTASMSQTYFVNVGGWYGPGWYWNPWWSMYSFVPGGGFFYNPFGYGLYSPVFYGGLGYRGLYGGRAFVGGAPLARSGSVMSSGVRSGGMMGGGHR